MASNLLYFSFLLPFAPASSVWARGIEETLELEKIMESHKSVEYLDGGWAVSDKTIHSGHALSSIHT